MTQKSSVSTLSGKQLLSPSHGTYFSSGVFTEPSHWPERIDGESLHESKLEQSDFSFLLLLHRALLSICGVCEWREWDFWTLDCKERVAKRFVLACLWHNVELPFTTPLLPSQICLFLLRSRSLKIVCMRSKKTWESLMKIPILFFLFVCVCVSCLSDAYIACMSTEDRPQQKAIICSTYPLWK